MSKMTDMSRDEVETLLVFLANDTLQGQEREAVEAAVAKDAGLNAELLALRKMRFGLQKDTEIQSPGEFGLARLMRDIDAETVTAVTHVAANTPSRPTFWKYAAVILLGLMGAQSAFVYLGSQEAGQGFQLASGEAPTGQEDMSLRVDFAPDAQADEIARVLLDLDLVIVDGPSALGFYTLQARDETAYHQAVESLKTIPELVDIVE